MFEVWLMDSECVMLYWKSYDTCEQAWAAAKAYEVSADELAMVYPKGFLNPLGASKS